MSDPTWRLTIDTDPTTTAITQGPTPSVWVVEGSGPKPTLEDLTVSPPGDPADPPPGDPPVTPPVVVDDSPFVWPPEWMVPGQASDRTKRFWLIPGRRDDDPHGKLYAMIASGGTPSAGSHHNAGIISGGDLVGYRLWAPHDAPPAMLRAILERGQP